ncbi:MAG: cobalamin B12-binding domain-containing protein, partial [Chloroflexota bacterium]
MDILLTHGYFLYDDPHELQVMRPYPPLGILYISSYLKSKGFAVDVFDTTFSNMDAFQQYVRETLPPVVGIYTNMMTKRNVLKMISFLKSMDIIIVLGGPDPPYYAEQYLNHGADVVIQGEGELTLE